jgi:hypothetical protein
MFLIGPHGALLHNETHNKIHHGPIHLPKQPKQPIILVQREFYRKVGEGQCTLESKIIGNETKLGILHIIYSATQVVLLVVWIKL